MKNITTSETGNFHELHFEKPHILEKRQSVPAFWFSNNKHFDLKNMGNGAQAFLVSEDLMREMMPGNP